MYFFQPHLRNANTYDTVILFHPAEPNPHLWAGHSENPTPTVAFQKWQRLMTKPDGSLCLLPWSRSPSSLHPTVESEGVLQYRFHPGDNWTVWIALLVKSLQNQLSAVNLICACAFSVNKQTRWPLSEAPYLWAYMHVCICTCACVWVHACACV